MKRIVIMTFLLAMACAPVAAITSTSTPLATPFDLPNLMATPKFATPTPIIVTPTSIPEVQLFYMVQKSDTLSGIAYKFGLTVDYLVSVNNLRSADWIYEGQTLILRSREEILEIAYAEKGKKVIVILSTQRAYALEDRNVLKEFVVSTGVAAHPTVVGRYPIYIKLESTTMSGPGYYLTGVPYTMYFYQGYGLHGTYWHHNFGHPMSHGCVNMITEDAHWVFDWAPIGTPVWVLP
jgi:lipoprotein-anchoring transpeptidase ErfK/SrfK